MPRAEITILRDTQPFKQQGITFSVDAFLKIQLKKTFQRIHEKRFTETPWTGEQKHLITRLHQRLDERRFIDVITILPNHITEVLNTDRQGFLHIDSAKKQSIRLRQFNTAPQSEFSAFNLAIANEAHKHVDKFAN